MRFDERTHKFEYKLNDTDDQIIDYIKERHAEFVTQSIQTVAANVFTVPNTITRLSKKLGYDGFSHMKSSLKEELESPGETPEDDSHSLIQKTFEILDKERMEEAARLLVDSKQIQLFGVGDSSDLCEMVARNFRVVGKPTHHHVHRHEILHSLDQMNHQSILFLISLSGETPLVIEAATKAKERNIPMITLTHFTKNTLQSMAAINLYCYAPKKTKNGYNITARTPVMVVLEMLSHHFWAHY
ncbi:MurR/RpiR family transcriptional regulator [Rossellomorea marisflavi]|uniref:MurR/RpiR family transcriptional regulator n=1 Tax=Rossellomorea marisflavi TaxID=189381 RepID=UPI00345AF6FB